MASELELAGLIARVGADADEEEIFAAQWQHESDNEPLSAAIYLFSNADPAQIAGGAGKIKELRTAAANYSTELTATPPDQAKLTTLREQLYKCIGALKMAPDEHYIEQRTQRKRRKLEEDTAGNNLKQKLLGLTADAVALRQSSLSARQQKPAVKWTEGLEPNIAATVYEEMHKPAKGKGKAEGTQYDAELEEEDLEYGEARLADGGVVKATKQPMKPIPEVELLQPSGMGESVSVLSCAQELDLKHLSKEQIAREYLKFQATRGEKQLPDQHQYFAFLKTQGFHARDIDVLQAKWKSYVEKTLRPARQHSIATTSMCNDALIIAAQVTLLQKKVTELEGKLTLLQAAAAAATASTDAALLVPLEPTVGGQ